MVKFLCSDLDFGSFSILLRKKNPCQVDEIDFFKVDKNHIERAWQRGSGRFPQFSKYFVRAGKISEVKLDRVLKGMDAPKASAARNYWMTHVPSSP